MIQDVLHKLIARQDLTRDEMKAVMEQVADGKATPVQSAALLIALRAKGETVTEIAAAAEVMRARVDKVKVTAPIFIDTCGTGGDGQNTFNISTASAFVVSAAGVTVAKHGNRSVSSRCGSADVLSALGVNIDVPKELVEACIAQIGIGFLFAPKLHPAFKAVAAVRKELGVRTVFNLLGPLVNPAGALRQVMGVYDEKWVPVLGGVLAALGAEDAYVVHGGGLDEISVTAETLLARVRGGEVQTERVTPEALGLARWTLKDLAGGDAEHNSRILRDVLSGQKGAPRDAVLANAGAGLVVGGAVKTLAEGVKRAAATVDSGAATEKLNALVKATTR
jgi:anthranilate phosphoribosyltransferase